MEKQNEQDADDEQEAQDGQKIHDEQNRLLREMNDRVKKMAREMEHTTIADYILLLNSPKKLILTNLLAGVSRGVGIAIGFTLIASTIVYVLHWIVDLNIPFIGNIITKIVLKVQEQLAGRGY